MSVPVDPQTDWEALIDIATTALERADKALDNITGWSGGGGNWPAQDAHVRVQAALLVLRSNPADTLVSDSKKLRDLSAPRPREDYHEDMGVVLWWKLPVCEPPFVGREDDEDLPEYMTHWTPLPKAPGEP